MKPLLLHKILLLFVVLLVIPQDIFTQNMRPDSLQNMSYAELEKAFSDSQKKGIDSLAEKYARIYLKKAKKDKDAIKLADGYKYKSYISDFDDAIQYSDSILLVTKAIQHKSYPALAYMLKGHYYYNEAKDKEALEYYIKANKYAIKNNNVKQQISIKQTIANIKIIAGNYEEALEIYKEQFDFLRKQPNFKATHEIHYVYTLDHLSKAYLNKKELDSAAIYINEGIRFSTKTSNKEMYHNFLLNNGVLNYFQKNNKTALDSLYKVKPYLKSQSLSICYYYIGKVYEKVDLQKTIDNFIKVDSIYNKNKISFIELRDVYKTLFTYYSNNGTEKEQLNSIKKLIKIDSILDIDFKTLNNQIVKNYEIPKLKGEKQKLEQRLIKNNRMSTLTIVVLTFFLIITFFFVLKFYRRQNLYKKRYDEIIAETEPKNVKNKPAEYIVNDNLNIPENVVNDILDKLIVFEQQKKFLENGLTLNKFSKTLNTNSSYLSRIINHYKKQSFSTYLAKLRIDYTIHELKSNITYRNFSITAIAQEVGYNNAESFSKAFFKEKGIYPSYFIKQLNKENVHNY